MISQDPHSSMGTTRDKEHCWLVRILCVLTLFAVAYVMVQAGVPLLILVLILVVGCLTACGWAVLVAVRTRGKVDRALRQLMSKGDLLR